MLNSGEMLGGAFVAPSLPTGQRGGIAVRVRLALTLLGLCGLSLAGSAVANTLLKGRHWSHGNFHAVIESLGMFAGLTLAVLLIVLRRYRTDFSSHVWTACGLISMGILDGCHAVSSPGNTFVWFHVTATLSGGFWFALVWVPERFAARRGAFALPLLALVSVAALATGSVVSPAAVPVMVSDGQFSLLAHLCNVAGGLGFLAAGIWFLRRYARTVRYDDLLLAVFSLLFGMAGVLLWLSRMWSMDWWWWHFLRVGAYMLVLGYVFLLFVRDQIELRDLNQVLQQRAIRTEARTQAILDTAADGIIVIDERGMIDTANPAAERLFGYAAGELIGQNVNCLMPAQHRERHDGYLANYLATNQKRFIGIGREVMGTRKDGSMFPLAVSVSEVRLNGRPLFTGILRDVTERVEMEERLRQAKEAAEMVSKAKSEFLANMSHEIRTPMNGILGLTDLILETELNTDQRESVGLVKSSADALLTIINDILDFSKIEAGKLDLDPHPFAVGEAVGDTLKALGGRAHAKGLELTYDPAFDVPERVVGDAHRLRQVLTNLVGNAIKFTDRGEVVVRCERVPQDGPRVRLRFAVTDTGIGIAPDKLRTVFEPFTQADGSTTRKYGGTGLGLTICTRLVALMDGRVWAESEPGRGSTFSFEVGLEPDLGPAEPAVSPAALTGVPVLVVDDNATNRRVLAGLVQRWGGRPVCAADGPKGLTELTAAADRGEPFSLVLLDATMPGMDGFAVAERICRDPQLGTAAVLMLTSADRPGDAARCRALGVAAFLVKPVHPAELNRRIASALGDPGHSAIGRATQPAPAARPTAPGTRLTVLLAEDNAVNQRLAVRLLEKLGHTVTVVGDGRRAVEAHADRVYDLVLMDVQMPEMDGFEATAGIRRREAEGARRTPIVAMTAHAMKGDRERCLAGGMDDYLSKPIQREELFRVLKRAEEMNSRAQSGGGDERGSNGVGAPAFDRAVALERLGGD